MKNKTREYVWNIWTNRGEWVYKKNKTHSCIKCKREFYISNWNQHLEWHDRQEEKSKMPPKKKDYTERKWVTKMIREMFLEEFELSVSQRPIPKNGRKWCSILNRSWSDECECERLEQGWTLKEYKEIQKERTRMGMEELENVALQDYLEYLRRNKPDSNPVGMNYNQHIKGTW